VKYVIFCFKYSSPCIKLLFHDLGQQTFILNGLVCAFGVITFLFVQGPEMQTKKMAKRAVALEVCELLHKLGELNEHLLPVEREDPIEACAELFPLYKEETGDNVPQRGTNKRKEQYGKEVCLQFYSPLV
jgi:hypothetical protein